MSLSLSLGVDTKGKGLVLLLRSIERIVINGLEVDVHIDENDKRKGIKRLTKFLTRCELHKDIEGLFLELGLVVDIQMIGLIVEPVRQKLDVLMKCHLILEVLGR